MLFLLSYVRRCARLESNQRTRRIRAALSTELRAFKPPAGIEPAPRPYKGRVLPLTLRRQRWRWQESNLRLLGASEVLCHQSFIPKCGRMESNHHSLRRRVYSAGSSPVLSVRVKGWPTGFEPTLRGSRPRVLAVTPQPPCDGDDRIRTGDLSPDKRVLFSAELRPQISVSWLVADRPYASGTVSCHTARSQEGGQRREAAA
jgi:hypothetical protein